MPQINASMFLDGITHYRQFQLASALVFLWSTAESLIGKIWDDKIIPKGKGIFGRGDFVKSSAWQSASKAEVLFQTGCISDGLYGNLNQARSARNYLAHRVKLRAFKHVKKPWRPHSPLSRLWPRILPERT